MLPAQRSWSGHCRAKQDRRVGFEVLRQWQEGVLCYVLTLWTRCRQEKNAETICPEKGLR